MEPMFYVMAIMGCGDGTSNCAQARVEPIHYRTIRQCEAAMPAALIRNSDIEYPVVSAACRSVGQQLVQVSQDHRRG